MKTPVICCFTGLPKQIIFQYLLLLQQIFKILVNFILELITK
jgi:hypothetical protein